MEKLLMRSPAPALAPDPDPDPSPDPDPDPFRSVAGLCNRRRRLILSGRMVSGGGLGEPTEISETAGLLQLRVPIIATGLGVRCGIFNTNQNLTLQLRFSVNFRLTQNIR